jgi:hypothetical protein
MVRAYFLNYTNNSKIAIVDKFHFTTIAPGLNCLSITDSFLVDGSTYYTCVKSEDEVYSYCTVLINNKMHSFILDKIVLKYLVGDKYKDYEKKYHDVEYKHTIRSIINNSDRMYNILNSDMCKSFLVEMSLKIKTKS